MVSVQINLLFGLCIDLILWSFILASLFVNFFSYENYILNLSGISSEWEINNQETQAYLDFTHFEDVECGDEAKSPQELCDNILGLKLAGFSYQSLSILALISLTLSVIHYILLISLRIRTLIVLEYFHITSMPIYFIATGLYIFLSSFNDFQKAKAEEGVIISYFTCGIGVIELFYFVYLKKYKDWRLELLRYQTLEESNRCNLPRTYEDLAYSQAPATDRTKIDDVGKLYYDLMEKYESEVNEKKDVLNELKIYQQELEKYRGNSKPHEGEIRSMEHEKELIDLHKKLKDSHESVQLLEKELIEHREHPLKELYSNNLDIIRQKEQEITEAYALVNKLQEDRERLINEIDVLKEDKDVEELCLSYENSLKEKDLQLDEKDKSLADKEQQLDDKDKELEDREKEIDYLMNIHKESEETLGDYKSKFAEYEAAIQDYKNSIEDQEVTVKEKEFENNALYNKLERAVNDKEDLQIQIRNLKNCLNKEKEKLEEEVNKYEEIVEEKDQEIEALNEEAEEKDREILRLHEEIDNMLANMVDHTNTNTDRSYRTIEDHNQADYSFIKTDQEEEQDSLSKDEVISQDSHVLEEYSEENEDKLETEHDELEENLESEREEFEEKPATEHEELQENSEIEHEEFQEKPKTEHSETEQKSDSEHSEQPEEKSDSEHSEQPEEKSDSEHSEQPEQKSDSEHSEQPEEKSYSEHSEQPEEKSDNEHLEQPEKKVNSEDEQKSDSEHPEPEETSDSKNIGISKPTDLKDQIEIEHEHNSQLSQSVPHDIEFTHSPLCKD